MRIHQPSTRALAAFSHQEILPLIGKAKTHEPTILRASSGEKFRVRVNSDKFRLLKKQPTCVCCGVMGVIWVMEQPKEIRGTDRAVLNLYGVTQSGRWVLMTKDHIVPRASGGRNALHNYQTMCCACNVIKSDLEGIPMDRLRQARKNEAVRTNLARLRQMLQSKMRQLPLPFPGNPASLPL